MRNKGEKKQEKDKIRSLSGKIMKWIAIPVVAVFLISGLFILNTVNMEMTEMAEKELVTTSQSASYQISEVFTVYVSRMQEASANALYEEIMLGTGKNESLAQSPLYNQTLAGLKKAAAMDENILSSWLADFDSSSLIMSDGFISEPGWDVTKRPWYRVAEIKKPLITEPYEDVSTGKQVVTIVAPVYDNSGSNIIGAAGVDIAMEQLSSIMEKYNSDSTLRFVLSDTEGTIIYHPDVSLIGKAITEIGISDNMANNIMNNVTEFTQFTYNGVKSCGYVSMVGDTNWNITSVKTLKDFDRAYNQASLLMIIIFLIGIVCIILILGYISSTIVKPLKLLTRAAKEIAKGNLEVEVSLETKDETKLLAGAISDTVYRLKDYIEYINEIGYVLDQIADGDLKFELKCDYVGEFAKLKTGLLNIQKKLTGMLREINETAIQVSEGAGQIAQTAATIAESSTEQASSVDKLSQSILEVAELTQQNSDSARTASESAVQASGFLSDGNAHIVDLTKTIEKINEVSQRIHSIMASINDIAEQTNLLSLNASIEAARAGEAGRGFAVVAGEIGRLAIQTTGSSSETEELVNGILSSISEGTSMAQKTTGVMDNVLNSAGQTTGMIEDISDAIVQEKIAIDKLQEEINQIMAMVQNNTAASEESVAASEALANQAEKLEELVGSFRI